MITKRVLEPEDLLKLEREVRELHYAVAVVRLYSETHFDYYVCDQWAKAIVRDNPNSTIATSHKAMVELQGVKGK